MVFLRVNSVVSTRHEMESNWWAQINESTQYQDAIFSTLCASYALLSILSLIQLIRIEIRVPEYGLTTQKVFHFMNFIVSGMRATIFGFHVFAFALKPKVLLLILLDFPGLLFFTTYTLLVLLWAEICYQVRNTPTDKLRTWYFSVNLIIYIIPTLIWIYIWMHDSSFVESIGHIFIAAVSFFIAMGFLLYGGRLFCMLQGFPYESRGKRKKLHEVGSVTAIGFTCFLVRCIMVLSSAFVSDASLDVLDHPILNLIYYMLVEILPSALVLFIMRKLPPKRKSSQYHRIRHNAEMEASAATSNPNGQQVIDVDCPNSRSSSASDALEI